MDFNAIKLECLRLALGNATQGATAEQILMDAAAFEAYVLETKSGAA